MAAALATLEDLTTCPVCFEFYNKPKSLSCLHVLCAKCVEKITDDNNQIECPECRSITESNNVKNDFNKQTLVDLYLKQQAEIEKSDISERTEPVKSTEENNSGILTCENCKKPKEVEWKCSDCNKFMCPNCEDAHKNFPVTANHKVTSITEVKESIKKCLKETIEKLNQNCELLRVKSEKHEVFLNDFEEKKSNAAAKIKQYATKLKESIDEHHNKQLSKFDFNMTDISDKVSEQKGRVDTYTKEMKNKVILLSDMIEKNNTTALVKHSQQFQQGILSTLENIKLEVENMKEPIIPSIKINEPEPWVSSKGTTVYVTSDNHVEETQATENEPAKEMTGDDFVVYRRQNSENVEKVGYLKIFDGKPKLKRVQEIKLGYVPLRLCAIGETLWCTGQDGLHVYDKNLNFVISLNEDRVKDPTCITKDSLGNIFAATNWKLHHLDHAGKYVGELALGRFLDIALKGTTMYALDYRKQKILIFQYKRDTCWYMPTSTMRWCHTNTVNLERVKQMIAKNKSREIHNIAVSNDTIYASSWEGSEHCLYKICKSSSSDLLVPIHADKADGGLYQPKLCTSDEFGNVLVADGKNNFLRVCSVDGKWSKLLLEGNDSKLEDAIVDDRGKFLWTITKDCCLVKYVI